MHVSCPNCGTVFSLPDTAYKAGRSVRCSQCQFVFSLPELGKEKLSVLQRKILPFVQRLFLKRNLFYLGGVLSSVLLLFVAYYGYSYYSSGKFQRMVEARKEMREKDAAARAAQDKSVESLILVNVRQTIVTNKLLGPLVVIEGYVRNDFSTARDFIVVEAKLLNEAGDTLASTKQICGPTLTLTQLEVLGREALEKVLSNKIDIYGKNTNVEPGTQVPFVILFAGIPKDLYSYEIRPVSAELSTSPDDAQAQ